MLEGDQHIEEGPDSRTGEEEADQVEHTQAVLHARQGQEVEDGRLHAILHLHDQISGNTV